MMHNFALNDGDLSMSKERTVKHDCLVLTAFSAHIEPELAFESLEKGLKLCD